jgi:hypothetical protein
MADKAREILTDFHDNIIAVIDSQDEEYHKAVDEAEDKALHSLAELVRQEKKEIKDAEEMASAYYKELKSWNQAIEHIALLIEGKQGKGE